ncbi:IQ-domain [Ranunculus cassubicifolius]
MAKIRNWLNRIKKLFISDAKANPEKREKNRRWITGRFKRKRLPALPAPPVNKNRSLTEAKNQHNVHAWTAAIASTAAAEAALASAQAAVEVVRLSGTPWPYFKPMKGSRVLAATTIQTAFRGYLARKALRALKGLVRLQAIVRGQAVRRQVITTLNGLQKLVKIQSQLRVTKRSMEGEQFLENSYEMREMKPESNSQRVSIGKLPPKEDIDALFFSKREALIKRERVKEYLLSHREMRNTKKVSESEATKVNGNVEQPLGQWTEKSDFIIISKPVQRYMGGHTSPITPPRRSFDRPRRNSFEDSDFLSSPIVPNYMSATESTKARFRSISLPKQGLGAMDIYSDYGSPAKSRISFSSFSTDAGTTIKSSKGHSSQQSQRSPSLKGVSRPIKSYKIARDLSVDSDSSFLSWVPRSGHR